MIPATEPQVSSDGETTSSLGARLELLLQHAIATEQFEADMVRTCRLDPEEIWSLLALLDQYHRLGRIPTELFRALKASADRYGLVRREPYVPELAANQTPQAAPPVPTPVEQPAPSSLAATPLPVPVEAAVPSTQVESAPPVAMEPAGPSALGVGSVLGGRYQLEVELASDDRGRIFQALDQQHAGQPAAVCQVAVHCMQPAAADFDAVLAERRQEFQLAQPLAHPNIVTVRELDQNGQCIYLTMNLLRGESLEALLAQRRGQALPRAAALTIIRDIGAALTYAHEHGVIHGDLQPQRVQISPAGELRVRGFGAQRANSCYASGEQLESRAADRRDDLYALACMSYELLHGSHPFGRLTAATARGRGLVPKRPIQLTGKQWRALRMGLAWRREARAISIERWLRRLQVGRAAKRLPTLEHLLAMSPPRRSWWRPLLLVGALAAAIFGAVGFDRLPGLATITREWNSMRSVAAHRSNRPAPPATVAPAAPVPPVATEPAPATSTPVPAVPKSVPAAPLPEPAALLPPPPPTLATKAPAAMAVTVVAAPARIELSADQYNVQPGDSAARIIVRRSGELRGAADFTWWTENASAVADVDFIAWGRRAAKIPAGKSSVTLLVPIVRDATRTAPRTFKVSIEAAGDGLKLGATTQATVLLPGSG